MRCHIPIVYLVDSAGVNLPYQGGVFPGQVRSEAASSTTTRSCGGYLRIPQLAAVMGQCIAGGAYLASTLRPHHHGEGLVVHGPGRTESRERAPRAQTIDSETPRWRGDAYAG